MPCSHLILLEAIFGFSYPLGLKYGLQQIYFLFGLLSFTAGYIVLRGISKRLENLVKIEIGLLAIAGVYRLYAYAVYAPRGGIL